MIRARDFSDEFRCHPCTRRIPDDHRPGKIRSCLVVKRKLKTTRWAHAGKGRRQFSSISCVQRNPDLHRKPFTVQNRQPVGCSSKGIDRCGKHPPFPLSSQSLELLCSSGLCSVCPADLLRFLARITIGYALDQKPRPGPFCRENPHLKVADARLSPNSVEQHVVLGPWRQVQKLCANLPFTAGE